MNAEALKPPRLPFNARLLRWAREWRGRSVAETAKRLTTAEQNIRDWEAGVKAPSVRQARMLAEFYDRAFLEFFLDEPPPVRTSVLVPDFRIHKGEGAGDVRELQAVQAWAEEQRLNAIDLYELIGDEPPAFPEELIADVAANPDWLASEARKLCNFNIAEQLALTSQDRSSLPKTIRKAVEGLGVVVLKNSALAKHGVRGMCIFSNPLPAIVFGTEAPAAQCFTIAHELAHIILQQSALSGPPSASGTATPIEAIERWCDKFAGAFLIPADALASLWAKPNRPQPGIGDELLARLANTFGISKHAMLIRLVDLQYVDAGFYWNVKRPEFLQIEQEFKGGGRAKYYGSRYRSAHGDLYTGLVLEAWATGAITNHNAAEFMGIKNLQHLEDIREDFRS